MEAGVDEQMPKAGAEAKALANGADADKGADPAGGVLPAAEKRQWAWV